MKINEVKDSFIVNPDWRLQPSLQDVLKTLRCLTIKQDVVTMSGKDVGFITSWRRLIYVILKTSDLRCLENVWFATSWRLQIYDVLKMSVKLCSNVVATSMQRRTKCLFSYFVLSEIFTKLLVFRYAILYKSVNWFIYDRNLRHKRVNHT